MKTRLSPSALFSIFFFILKCGLFIFEWRIRTCNKKYKFRFEIIKLSPLPLPGCEVNFYGVISPPRTWNFFIRCIYICRDIPMTQNKKAHLVFILIYWIYVFKFLCTKLRKFYLKNFRNGGKYENGRWKLFLVAYF